MTVHFVTSEFVHTSFAIACRIFNERHDFKNISGVLIKVMRRIDIEVSKVAVCVTYNGSINFRKAFEEFGMKLLDGESDVVQDEGGIYTIVLVTF